MASLKTGQEIWQVAAGPSDLSCVSEFLNYGVALIGPGDTGPWESRKNDNALVRRFASKLKEGDILLLRRGVATIHAVGIVASEYQYFRQFDDVNGLALQHGRRVRWRSLPEPYTFDEQVFGTSPTQLSQVHSKQLVDYVNEFIQSPPVDWQRCSLPGLPPEEPTLKTYPCGLRELIVQAENLQYVYGNSDFFGESPSENEVIAHYVVPFLRALEWPVERIAVEWRKVDVSVFTTLPRIPEHCHYLIEAKRLGTGLEDAVKQVVRYAKNLNIRCDVVVTDGIRYCMYAADKNYTQVAYANMGRLKESSQELFKRMKKP